MRWPSVMLLGHLVGDCKRPEDQLQVFGADLNRSQSRWGAAVPLPLSRPIQIAAAARHCLFQKCP
jgi:hypothetical protein